MKLSTRVDSIQPSPTLAIVARTQQLKAQGKDIIGLSAGEPDFDTPEHIKEAAIKAIRDGFTKYTPAAGTKELINAIKNKFSADNNLDYKDDEIIVSVGAKHSIYNCLNAVLNPGDEVIIPAPYWVSYPDMVRLAGGTPVIITTHHQSDYKISAEQLDAAITDKTRLIIFNSPSNPSGSSYTFEEYKELGTVLSRYPELYILTDDIYEHIQLAGDVFCNIVNACPELFDRTIVINGVSKAYAMTGWRIGYAAGPKPVISAMRKIQSQSTSNPTSIAQVAAQTALESDQSCITVMVEAFKQRHDFLVDALNDIPGLICPRSRATFYSFPHCGALIDKLPHINNDIELAEQLLIEANIAIVPGTAFGSPNHLRFSFATDIDLIKEAVSRFKAYVARY